ATRPPKASTRPGRPAPTMGPGTAAGSAVRVAESTPSNPTGPVTAEVKLEHPALLATLHTGPPVYPLRVGKPPTITCSGCGRRAPEAGIAVRDSAVATAHGPDPDKRMALCEDCLAALGTRRQLTDKPTAPTPVNPLPAPRGGRPSKPVRERGPVCPQRRPKNLPAWRSSASANLGKRQH